MEGKNINIQTRVAERERSLFSIDFCQKQVESLESHKARFLWLVKYLRMDRWGRNFSAKYPKGQKSQVWWYHLSVRVNKMLNASKVFRFLNFVIIFEPMFKLFMSHGEFLKTWYPLRQKNRGKMVNEKVTNLRVINFFSLLFLLSSTFLGPFLIF